MRFRWEWLAPVVPVPYVPTLGPVGPGTLSAELFNAVVEIAGTGRFLPYDKDQRWFSTKDERVIVDRIVHKPDRTLVPTLSSRERHPLKVHYYADSEPRLAEITGWLHTWCTVYRISTGVVIWFQSTAHGASTRLMLKTFTDQDEHNDSSLTTLADCEVADTFPAFAEQLKADGFAFLGQRIKAGLHDGPIFVAVDDQRIVGAVGPLTTLPDANGTLTQLPHYFAVHPDYRHRGHGRALWRRAMAWGAQNGAAYKVLQAATGSAAEQLYISENMSTLGFVCRREVPLEQP